MNVFFFKQKTAYEMHINDWSSDVCSSDLRLIDNDESARINCTTNGADFAMSRGESPSQLEKFKQAARELEADEDEGRWDERLKKVVKAKPKPKPNAGDS